MHARDLGGGRATPDHPRKRRHFTPNPVKRPVFLRFGVKFREKSFKIPPFSGSVEPERPSVARPSGMYGSNPGPEPQQHPQDQQGSLGRRRADHLR
ncbi:hypothetical protein CDPW8_0029 [Corynebacterium diphtheriae PW8]|nr:hypothetical protein CDPW8_0029 [Corynebacterium diphtheriae PW8]